MSVVIETTIGDITVDLFIEERPLASLNFIKLCKLKYYNFNLFHTVEQGFIAQTGDPTGVGDGGSSVWGVVEGLHKRFFEAESQPKIKHNQPGLLSLVSLGQNLVGSQFIFTLGADLTSLDGIHCVIGEVVEGHETLRKLNETIVDEKHRPFQDVRITHTVILDDPFANPRGFRVPSRSPSPSQERLQNGRIAADENIDDTGGKSAAEVQEMLAEREAKARATILEIVGDLPDAEVAPPENVLFVCKLNPVTTEDDLEIIFSRFGKVKNCDVIRDRKTGDSLQYAFIEFHDQKSCESAYFKMDNVLIDDRRIHVDFSQSVAKVKWRGKGRGVEGQEGQLDFNNLGKQSDKKNHRKETDARPKKEREKEKEREKDKDNKYSRRSPTPSLDERRRAREERHRLREIEVKNRQRRRRSESRSRRRRSPKRQHRERESSRDRHRRENKPRHRSRDATRRRLEEKPTSRRNHRDNDRTDHQRNGSTVKKRREPEKSSRRHDKKKRKKSSTSSDSSRSSSSSSDSSSKSTSSSERARNRAKKRKSTVKNKKHKK